MTTKKPKKVRRIVLGVGHPWYFRNSPTGKMDSVLLTKTSPPGVDNVSLRYDGTGNWNKVRLVLEILK